MVYAMPFVCVCFFLNFNKSISKYAFTFFSILSINYYGNVSRNNMFFRFLNQPPFFPKKKKSK